MLGSWQSFMSEEVKKLIAKRIADQAPIDPLMIAPTFSLREEQRVLDLALCQSTSLQKHWFCREKFLRYGYEFWKTDCAAQLSLILVPIILEMWTEERGFGGVEIR